MDITQNPNYFVSNAYSAKNFQAGAHFRNQFSEVDYVLPDINTKLNQYPIPIMNLNVEKIQSSAFWIN